MAEYKIDPNLPRVAADFLTSKNWLTGDQLTSLGMSAQQAAGAYSSLAMSIKSPDVLLALASPLSSLHQSSSAAASVSASLKTATAMASMSTAAGELSKTFAGIKELGFDVKSQAVLREFAFSSTQLESTSAAFKNLSTLYDTSAFRGLGSELSSLTQATALNFKGIDAGVLFSNSLGTSAASALLTGTTNFANRNLDFISSLTLRPVPDRLEQLPTRGLHRHSATVRALTSKSPQPALGEDVDPFIADNLALLNPRLAESYVGMKTACRGRRDDWWTQAGSSGRKLVIGVLDAIAPDDVVVSWSKQNSLELHTPKVPTRHAKVLWLCSHVSNLSYRRCLGSQLTANLRVMNYLNKTQHTESNSELMNAFSDVVNEIEEMIRHLLTIWLIRLG